MVLVGSHHSVTHKQKQWHMSLFCDHTIACFLSWNDDFSEKGFHTYFVQNVKNLLFSSYSLSGIFFTFNLLTSILVFIKSSLEAFFNFLKQSSMLCYKRRMKTLKIDYCQIKNAVFCLLKTGAARSSRRLLWHRQCSADERIWSYSCCHYCSK